MSERILIVDDEADFLEVMAERMSNRGIEVTTALRPRKPCARSKAATLMP